ncbi:MAG: DMT family transporter, partial [Alphaproteobacteria bacterium]|nr:DMT family transporter [Alphaproteobacteria bacterium]
VPRPGLQILRGLAVSLGTICFFSAIFLMPLAEAATITFTSPILTAVLSLLFLREPAGRSTWGAMLAAFCGVLIVLRPNFAALGAAALLPLITAAGMSVLFICNRLVAGQASALAMQVYVAVAALPLLLVATLLGHYSGLPRFHVGWPEASVLLRCAIVATTATLGHFLIYLGTARAGAAKAAPMTYVQLLVAALLGWFWFGDVPDLTALAGAAIIVSSGIWLWRAEWRRARSVGLDVGN